MYTYIKYVFLLLFVHREFKITEIKLVYNRPSLDQMRQEYKRTNIFALVCGTTLTIILVILWPCIMGAIEILTLQQFQHWINLSDVWSFTAAIFIIATPLILEIWDIVKQFKHKKARVRVHAAPRDSLNHVMNDSNADVNIHEKAGNNGNNVEVQIPNFNV